MPSNNKLNNARITTFGSYRAVYDVECVDEKQKIYRGYVVPEPAINKIPGAAQALAYDWLFFTEEYDDRNDWDRLYHSLDLDDSWIGVPMKLVPKEKVLFAYSPPTTIALPPAGLNFKR